MQEALDTAIVAKAIQDDIERAKSILGDTVRYPKVETKQTNPNVFQDVVALSYDDDVNKNYYVPQVIVFGAYTLVNPQFDDYLSGVVLFANGMKCQIKSNGTVESEPCKTISVVVIKPSLID